MSFPALILMKKNVEIATGGIMEKNHIYKVYVIEERLQFLSCIYNRKRKIIWTEEYEMIKKG